MKVDFHCHTKKIKNGESSNRNVTAETFKSTLNDAGVGMVAITNHNFVDINQYNEFVNIVGNDFLIFPGVELDIKDLDGNMCHAIVVADSKDADIFGQTINSLPGIQNPNNFALSLADFVSLVNKFNCFVMVHDGKNRSFGDTSLKYLQGNIKNRFALFYEASSLRKAGIITNKNNKALIGSDVTDWNSYPVDKLPDIKLNIDSFEHLMLFFKKDTKIIESLLTKVNRHLINISYKDENNNENVNFYQGINVIFGAKATGKTEVLKSVESFFSDKNLNISTYYADSAPSNKIKNRLDVSNDERLSILKKYHQDNLEKEFECLKTWKEIPVQKLSEYSSYSKDNIDNQYKRKIALSTISQEVLSDDKMLVAIREDYKTIRDFKLFLDRVDFTKYQLSESQIDTIRADIAYLYNQVSNKYIEEFIKYQSANITNNSVREFKLISKIKDNITPIPPTCDFYHYAKNVINLKFSLRKIMDSFAKEPDLSRTTIGVIDSDKEIGIETIVRMFDIEKSKKDDGFESINDLKRWFTILNDMNKDFFNRSNLIEKLKDYRDSFEDPNRKLNLNNFTGVKKKFYSNNDPDYVPSGGESTMLLLNEALEPSYDVYLLDEPERSLNNNYVNDVLVPKLLDLEKQGKTIVLVTHNGNLAVRTMPYCSVLKTHDDATYKTYVGSPFSKELINIANSNDIKDWQDESIKILEGGKEAFDERGEIYYAK